MPFIPNSDADRRAMMDSLGIDKIEDLFTAIPEDARVKEDWLESSGKSERTAAKYLCSIAEKNSNIARFTSFLGGGTYDHYIPSIVGAASGRSEFVTAYTPYQPEVSQGTLQAIYEYQSMICELTGMDVSNASMYDGPTATAEAALLVTLSLKRDKILVAANLPDNYKAVIRTYCHGRKLDVREVPCPDGALDIETLRAEMDETAAGLIVQYPNFYGIVEPLEQLTEIVHAAGGKMIACVNPLPLAVLKTPGDCGVDIVTGEAQPLGNEPNFGGPYLGIFAAKQDLVRKIPGRLAGMTVDTEGRRGFVLTLQTREQHIRREKATSNICTNQGLMMLRAAIYLETMGKQGLREVAEQCLQKAHYLAERIAELPGFSLRFDRPFFHEFVVNCPVPAAKICETLIEDEIFAGIPLDGMLGPEALLVAVTEQRTREEMDAFVEKLKQFS